MEAKPKVFSYARYSSSIQGEGYSIARQEKRAKEWCDSKGLTIEHLYFDEGRSAYLDKLRCLLFILRHFLQHDRVTHVEIVFD